MLFQQVFYCILIDLGIVGQVYKHNLHWKCNFIITALGMNQAQDGKYEEQELHDYCQ